MYYNGAGPSSFSHLSHWPAIILGSGDGAPPHDSHSEASDAPPRPQSRRRRRPRPCGGALRPARSQRPELGRRRSIQPGRCVGRAAPGWLCAVDAACARAIVAQSADAGRHARRRCDSGLRDRHRSRLARCGAPWRSDRRAGLRVFGASRCARPAARPALLVPLHQRRCLKPYRTGRHAAGGGRRARAATFCLRLLLELRARLFLRLPASR